MRPKKYVVGKSGAKLRNICSEFCLHDGFLAKKWRQWSGCIDFNDSFSIMVYDGQFVVSFALVDLIGWGLELILSRWFRPLKFLLLLINEDNRTLRNYLSHRKHGSSFFCKSLGLPPRSLFVLCFLKSSLTSFEWSLDYIALAKVGQAWILQLRPRKFASLFSSNFDMLQRWSACVSVRACVWEYVHGCMCEWGRERERELNVKKCCINSLGWVVRLMRRNLRKPAIKTNFSKSQRRFETKVIRNCDTRSVRKTRISVSVSVSSLASVSSVSVSVAAAAAVVANISGWHLWSSKHNLCRAGNYLLIAVSERRN